MLSYCEVLLILIYGFTVNLHFPLGTTINDLGVGAEEIEKKNFLEGARPGKNSKGIAAEKINSFSIFPLPPRSLMVGPLLVLSK